MVRIYRYVLKKLIIEVNDKKYLQSYMVCGKLLMLRIKRWSADTSHDKEQFLKTGDGEVLRTSNE